MFKSISRKLLDRPNCVEELAEMREWMKSIPDIITEHSVTLHSLHYPPSSRGVTG